MGSGCVKEVRKTERGVSLLVRGEGMQIDIDTGRVQEDVQTESKYMTMRYPSALFARRELSAAVRVVRRRLQLSGPPCPTS